MLRCLVVRLSIGLLIGVAAARGDAQTTVTYTVSVNSDDADQRVNDGFMYVGDGYSYLDNYVGERFQNVTIPKGAVISSARLELFSYGSGTASFSVSMAAQAADTTSTFTSTAYNISNRPRTSAKTSWVTGSTSFTQGQSILSPNFASSIQEVVSRPGWASGNSLAVILTPVSGARGFWKRSGNATYAPKLHITYTLPPLVLHWKLDETSGSVAADSSTYGRNGATSGTTSWTSAARRNGGIDVNSSSKVAVNNLLGQPTSFTVAAWIDTDSVGANGGVAVSLGEHIALVMDEPNYGGGRPTVVFNYTNSYFEYLGGGEPAAGKGWRHYVAVFDTVANTLKLYIDGVLVASKTTTREIDWVSSLGTSTTAGGNSYPIGGYEFDGRLDDVRVYNTALTDVQVAEVYGLVAHWKLDESTGTTAIDSSLSGYNATLTGTENWTAGQDNGAHKFDYTDGEDHFTAPTNTVLDNVQEDDYTLMAYFRPKRLPPGTGTANDGAFSLLCKNGYHTGLVYGPTGNFFAQHWIATGPTWTGANTWPTTYPPGQFYHVAGVVSRKNGTVKVYVDGVLKETVTFTPGTTSYEYGTNRWRIGIGAPAASSYGQACDGDLDDVRIYNRAVTAAEVAAIAASGVAGHWRLDETSGVTAVDSSPAGADGTYVNAPTLGVAAVHKTGVNFNTSGTDNRVSLPNTVVDGKKYVSLAWWMKTTKSGEQAIVSGNRSGQDNAYLVHFGSSQELRLYVDGSALTWSIDPVNDGQWQHFVITYNGATGASRLYRNGSLLSQKTHSKTVTLRVDPSGLKLAMEQDSVDGSYLPSQVFSGALDDVRVYGRVVSDLEVAQLYGLIGHWKFDEGVGTVAADSSALGNNAAFNTGSPAWTLGVRGRALEFGGTTDVKTLANFDPPEEGAVSFWVRRNSDLTARQRPFGVSNAFECYQDVDGPLHFDLNYSGPPDTFATTEPFTQKGRWRHVLVQFRSSDDAYEVYVDGKLDHATVYSQNLTDQAAAPLVIGSSGSTAQRYDGAIDDFRVYNRWLQPNEIAEIYGLIGHWKLEETSGSVAIDSSVFGRHGTYLGTPTLAQSGPESGFLAAEFDGEDDCVMLPTFYDTFADGAAISAWVLPTAANSFAKVLQLSTGTTIPIDLGRSGSSNALRGIANNDSSHEIAGGIHNNVWRHYAMSMSSTGLMKLYRNGVLLTQATKTPPTPGPRTSNWIGASNWSADGLFEGRMRDVRLYSRSITDEEARAMYFGDYVPGLRIVKWVEVPNP